MAPDSVGTLLASAAYVWYGKISATLKTSRGAGVVTAFILLSDVKDEIDFEFVGVDLEDAQSNYYFQGITDCMLPISIHIGGTGLTSRRHSWKEYFRLGYVSKLPHLRDRLDTRPAHLVD